MTLDPSTRINQLSADLAAIQTRASKWSKLSHAWAGDTLKILLMPWDAPQAAAYWIFEPLSFAMNIKVPPEYGAILQSMNGFRGLGFDLYGFPSPELLVNRKTVRPLSIRTANEHWRYEFRGAEHWFHFGGCELTPEENGGYFYAGEKIVCLTEHGTVVDSWASFREFLESEVQRTEIQCINHDAELAALIRET